MPKRDERGRTRMRFWTTLLGAAAVLFSATPALANETFVPLYASLLAQYTRATDDIIQTRVDYRGLRKEPRWKQLVAAVEKTDPSALKDRSERLAYWINVYNILAIHLVVDAYPIESIKDIGSFFSPVWKVDAGKIGGRPYTLDEIEHEILRPMGEPRVHGAIVCASVSCPPLARTPFLATTLDAQLDAAVASWLSNPRKGVRVDRAANTITLSKIFDWFESDFDAQGGVIDFVRKHLPVADANWLQGRKGLEIQYFDYDWALNE